MRIIVIGAGSIGSHVSYRLAEQGAEVVVVDAGAPGQGTSAATFAWLSSFPQLGWGEEPGRSALRPTVHRHFDDIEAELETSVVSWCGSVTVANEQEAVDLRHRAEVCRQKGVDAAEVTGDELADIEPLLRLPEGETAFYEPASGWVDVAKLVQSLLDKARGLGARVVAHTAVREIEIVREQVRSVILATGERIEADAVVNCAGSWGTHVAALAGVTLPLQLLPGRILTTTALPEQLRPGRIINAPLWGIRPAPEGAVAINGRGARMDGEQLNIGDTSHLTASVTEYLPALSNLPIATDRIGIRPVPFGGPIIGAMPWRSNFYTVVSHGGIGWGPLWGWMAARELLHGESVPELAGMRPERFHRKAEDLGRFADDAEQSSSLNFCSSTNHSTTRKVTS